MSVTVDIPEVGVVEFPDAMSEDDIGAASRKLHSQAKLKSLWELPSPPARSMLDPVSPSDTSLFPEQSQEPKAGAVFESEEYNGLRERYEAAREMVGMAPEKAGERARLEEVYAQGLQHLGVTPITKEATGLTEPLAAISKYTGLTAKIVQDGMDAMAAYAARASGEVSDEEMQAMLAEPSRAPSTTAKVVAGAQSAVVESLDFFTSIVGVATLGTGAMPQSAQKTVAAMFVADMARSAPHQLAEFHEARKSGDVERTAKAITGMGLTATFITAGVKSIVKGEPSPQQVIEKTEAANAPATAEALRQIIEPQDHPVIEEIKPVERETPSVGPERVEEAAPTVPPVEGQVREVPPTMPEEAKLAVAELATVEPPVTTPSLRLLGQSPEFFTANNLRKLPPETLAKLANSMGVNKTVGAVAKRARERFAEMESKAVESPKPTEVISDRRETITGPEERKGSEMPAEPGVSPGPATQRPWDIIDQIESEFGKIRGKKSAKAGSEGYYGEAYKEATSGPARRLFSNARGSAPDEIADGLRRSGHLPQSASVDDLWEALTAANKARKGFRSQRTKGAEVIDREQAQRVDFEKRAFRGGKGKESIRVNELLEGDTLEIADTKFTVKEMVFDRDSGELAYVMLEDGRRFGVQTVGVDQVIHPDSGTVATKGTKETTIPKLRAMENQGDLLSKQQEPFALAAETGIDFERVAAEKAVAERAKAEGKQFTEKHQLPLEPKGITPTINRRAGESGAIINPATLVVEAFERLQKLAKGRRLLKGPDISRAVGQKDILSGRDWWASPEFLFRKDPLAGPLATKIVEAQLKFEYDARHASQRVEEHAKGISADDWEGITLALRELERGNSGLMDTLAPELRKAADTVRTEFERVRTRVAEARIEAIKDALSAPRRGAVDDILAGMPWEEAFRKHKLRRGTKGGGIAAVEEALQAIADAKNWGIEDYITHAEKGSYRVVADDGTTVAIGETAIDAALKAESYLAGNPSVKHLTIDDSFAPGQEFPTQLTQRQYWRLVKKASDALGQSAATIQRLLKAEGHVVTVKPTNKYTPFLEHRRDILKGEENIREILPTYFYSMYKKLALDPVLSEARVTLPLLAPETRTAVERLITDVRGSKTMGDKIADALLAPAGAKPFAYSRGVNLARNVVTAAKLGYRPVAALINRATGARKAWEQFGTRAMFEGRKWLKTEEGKRILKENEPYIGIDATFAVEGAAKNPSLPHPLGMFQRAERPNREQHFAAAYWHAKNRMGLKGAELVDFARWETRFAQFIYTSAALPKIMRGPSGRLVTQFKPFLLKELEYISRMVTEREAGQLARYTVGFLALGGPRAALIMIKSLPLIGLLGYWDKIEDWLNQNYPAASRGLPGAAGVDVSPSVAFQFPEKPEDWIGPFLSDLYKLHRDVTAPMLQGERRDWDDVAAWAQRLAPAVNYWWQLAESLGNEEGWITDGRGRLTYEPTTADKVKLGLGMKPLEKSVAEVERRYLLDTERIQDKNRARVIDDYLDALTQDDGAAMDKMADELAEYGVTREMLRNAMKQRNMEPDERVYRSLSKHRRTQEADRFEK